MGPRMLRITLGWETSNGRSFYIIAWKLPSLLQTKTILMPTTQTASGKIIIVTKSNKICSCWTKKNSKNFSMDTIMTRTSMKKWIKKNKRWNNNRIDSNARLEVWERKPRSDRKQEQEMRAVWSLRVREMILRVSSTNTRRALIYYNNHQTWI